MSIVISVKENVENVDELIIRTKAIKLGLICVYFERGKFFIKFFISLTCSDTEDFNKLSLNYFFNRNILIKNTSCT